MLEQYPAIPHQCIPNAFRRVVPLPKGHKLSVVESYGGYEVALLNPQNDLVSHPLFGNDEVCCFDEVEEVEEVIAKLNQELAA
jgi:hypothetical protein